MKKIILSFVFLIALLFINHSMFAQDDNNIMVVTTTYADSPEDGSAAEFDSLSALLNKNVVSKNSKIISRYLVRHFWGSDSRQIVTMTEYANMSDIALAWKEGDRIFKEFYPDEEDRKAFWKVYGKYWNGHHSDEIYSVLAKK